jgi:hypothetical protein
MKTLKIGVILLAFLLAAMVQMVSAIEESYGVTQQNCAPS